MPPADQRSRLLVLEEALTHRFAAPTVHLETLRCARDGHTGAIVVPTLLIDENKHTGKVITVTTVQLMRTESVST
jgi:hypothetical protein